MGCKVKEFIPNHQIFELQKEISNQQCNLTDALQHYRSLFSPLCFFLPFERKNNLHLGESYVQSPETPVQGLETPVQGLKTYVQSP
jgi:hypothetical protein